MEVFATALGIDENHDARTTAVLGIEVSGERLEFTNSVKAQRGVFAVVRSYVRIDDSIEKEIVCRPAHSIDIKIIGLVEDETELRMPLVDDGGVA